MKQKNRCKGNFAPPFGVLVSVIYVGPVRVCLEGIPGANGRCFDSSPGERLARFSECERGHVRQQDEDRRGCWSRERYRAKQAPQVDRHFLRPCLSFLLHRRALNFSLNAVAAGYFLFSMFYGVLVRSWIRIFCFATISNFVLQVLCFFQQTCGSLRMLEFPVNRLFVIFFNFNAQPCVVLVFAFNAVQ